jgi:hypothetical protein
MDAGLVKGEGFAVDASVKASDEQRAWVEGRASASYLSQAMRPTMSVASAVIT